MHCAPDRGCNPTIIRLVMSTVIAVAAVFDRFIAITHSRQRLSPYPRPAATVEIATTTKRVHQVIDGWRLARSRRVSASPPCRMDELSSRLFTVEQTTSESIRYRQVVRSVRGVADLKPD